MSRTPFTLSHEDNTTPHAETSQKALTCRWPDARGCPSSSLQGTCLPSSPVCRQENKAEATQPRRGWSQELNLEETPGRAARS